MTEEKKIVFDQLFPQRSLEVKYYFKDPKRKQILETHPEFGITLLVFEDDHSECEFIIKEPKEDLNEKYDLVKFTE